MKIGSYSKFLILVIFFFLFFSGSLKKEKVHTVRVTREGGIPISPYAFGNSYFNWVDYNKDGIAAIQGTEKPVKALRLNIIAGGNNQSDINSPELFDYKQMDRYIKYCRDVGAEPMMIVPVYANNVNRGPTTAQGAADIVTYINGTRKYGVKFWSVGWESDIYDVFFKTTEGHRVSNVDEYIEIWNSYAKAMVEANKAANSGVEITFVGPELGWRYLNGNDWLSPMLKKCGEYIDIVGLHVYGFAANELSRDRILNDDLRFRKFIADTKALIASSSKNNLPLAITSANICYDWDTNMYTEETRKLGPGTFYAAIWDADRMGVSFEENLWSFVFWDLAENVPSATENTVFGFVQTDPSKNPPSWILTPEYYAQQMVTTNFSGNAVATSGIPDKMSVYSCYDKKKLATTILIINKSTSKRILKLEVDKLKPLTVAFSPMSINVVTISDDSLIDFKWIEYTMEMADSGLPPLIKQ